MADIFSERLTDVNLPLHLPLLRDKSLLLLWPQQQPVNYMVFALNWSGFTCLYCELHGLYMSLHGICTQSIRLWFDFKEYSPLAAKFKWDETKLLFNQTVSNSTEQSLLMNIYIKPVTNTYVYKVGLIVEFLETLDGSLLKQNPCM